jgi:hypothetical protein
VRDTLVVALESCADHSLQEQARRFLKGLSCDELQYIADFLGASLLESLHACGTRAQLSQHVADFQRERARQGFCSDDQDRKAILLLEYLCRGGDRRSPVARTGHA